MTFPTESDLPGLHRVRTTWLIGFFRPLDTQDKLRAEMSSETGHCSLQMCSVDFSFLIFLSTSAGADFFVDTFPLYCMSSWKLSG